MNRVTSNSQLNFVFEESGKVKELTKDGISLAVVFLICAHLSSLFRSIVGVIQNNGLVLI